jgi:hypothetical protein
MRHASVSKVLPWVEGISILIIFVGNPEKFDRNS